MISSPTTPQPEPHRIWDLPEMAEKIILHLPLHDILIAQGVRKTWHDTVTTSPTIQRALFLQPLMGPTNDQLRRVRAHQNLRIPLPLPRGPGYVESMPLGVPKAASLNPLLVPFLHFTIATGEDKQAASTTHYHRQCVSLLPEKEHILWDSPASASWRRMLLVQPLAPPLHEQVHPGNSRQNRALRIEREGLSVEDFLTKTETHANRRREFEGPWTPPCELSAEYAVGLRTGMHWVMRRERPDDMENEGRARSARAVTGCDVIEAAAAAVGEEGLIGSDSQSEVQGEGSSDVHVDEDEDDAVAPAPLLHWYPRPVFKTREMECEAAREARVRASQEYADATALLMACGGIA